MKVIQIAGSGKGVTGMASASAQIIVGDCIAGMRTLADNSINCCITSPPYW